MIFRAAQTYEMGRTWPQWEAAFNSKESPADRRYDVGVRAAEIARMCNGDSSFEDIRRECEWLARLSEDIFRQIEASVMPLGR